MKILSRHLFFSRPLSVSSDHRPQAAREEAARRAAETRRRVLQQRESVRVALVEQFKRAQLEARRMAQAVRDAAMAEAAAAFQWEEQSVALAEAAARAEQRRAEIAARLTLIRAVKHWFARLETVRGRAFSFVRVSLYVEQEGLCSFVCFWPFLLCGLLSDRHANDSLVVIAARSFCRARRKRPRRRCDSGGWWWPT